MCQMEKLLRRCCTLALITGALTSAPVWADSAAASVDIDVLRARGLDPALASYFQKAAHFMPGNNRIAVSVNGIPKGQINALFNAQGELCFTQDLLQQAGLVVPTSWPTSPVDTVTPVDTATPIETVTPVDSVAPTASGGECRDYRSEYPQTQIELNPGTASVDLTVPDEALAEEQQNYGDYSSGGIAGMLNYQANGISSSSAGKNSRSMNVDTTAGFNAGDWIARSRQSFASRDGAAVWSHYSAYAQKTLVKQAMILQVGQINPNGSLFGVGPLYGLQLFPEQALGVTEGTQVMVTGIANTQAQVEVRQMGRVIYSTVVPPGPFSFSRLPLISDRSDLDVTVTESSGAINRFSVPASSFSTLGAPQGLSLAVGQLQNASQGERPWVATATNGWRVAPSMLLSAGGLAAQEYQGFGVSAENQTASWLTLSTQAQLSHDVKNAQQGASLQGNARVQLADRLSAGVGASYQTLDYSGLLDNIADDESEQTRTQSQRSATLSWSNDLIGGISAGYFSSTQFNGEQTRRLTGSWGTSIGRASLSVNIDHALGNADNADSRVYASLSIPFGRDSRVSSFMSSGNGLTSYGSTLSQRLGDNASYSLSAQQGSGGSQSYNGNLSLTPRYTQLALGYGRYGSGSSSYSYTASGGIAVHKHGITLSPYPIQETFGIAHVGDLSGIQVTTPQGPAWSDHWGNVVIPTLPAFRPSRVEISTKSLPHNVDVKNGTQEINAGHGSVNYFQFDVVKVQRLLLQVHLADGVVPPKGSTVANDKGDFVSIVGDDGAVFFNNGQPDEKLFVSLANNKRCQLEYQVPDASESQYYQNADAVCK
ncbi:Outer membrane fimbrial usher protein [Yersinia mollaretii]|nr:Outer membrane fimbrial usher protein [Yersinia mollaretii]